MKRNTKLWSAELWRWLWFVKQMPDGMMVFEDAAGIRFAMSKDAASMLTERSWK